MSAQRIRQPTLEQLQPTVRPLLTIAHALYGRRWRGPDAWPGRFARDLGISTRRLHQIMSGERVPKRILVTATALMEAHQAKRKLARRSKS